MIPNSGVPEVIDILRQRAGFIERVQEDAKDKRTLVESLDCSRSTVDRGVRELEALELLTYGEDGYEPTVCGELAAVEYRRFERRMELLLAFQPFLEWIPPAAFDLELEWLADAELLLPEAGDPYAMINRHVQLVKHAQSGTALLPLTGLHAHEAGYESIVKQGGEGELIVSPTVAKTLQDDPGYAELTEEMVATGRFDIYVYDGPIPYAVLLLDETVQIGVDEGGEPRALLETESEQVRTWAEEKIETYKQQSTNLTPILTS